MSKYAILKGSEVIVLEGEKTEVLLRWAEFFEDPKNKRIMITKINNTITISTVFLGLDHSFGFGGPPLWFETMIFGGVHDGFQVRYSTYREAISGHRIAVNLVRGGNKNEESS